MCRNIKHEFGEMVPSEINAYITEERREISRLMIEFKLEMDCNNIVWTVSDGKFSFDVAFAYVFILVFV